MYPAGQYLGAGVVVVVVGIGRQSGYWPTKPNEENANNFRYTIKKYCSILWDFKLNKPFGHNGLGVSVSAGRYIGAGFVVFCL